jgi:ComF family protein
VSSMLGCFSKVGWTGLPRLRIASAGRRLAMLRLPPPAPALFPMPERGSLRHKLKYAGKDYVAGPLGRLLAEKMRESPELRVSEGIVPVPLHFWRERKRGYNQSELLAVSLGNLTGLPVERRALKKIRPTRSQTELSREERIENVAGAFAVRRPETVRGRTLVLVDDVCTTGATLDACASALKEAGAKRVLALTVARQI